LDSGPTNGFITVDNVNLFNLPVVGTIPFNLIVPVHPGSTIDFGVTAGSDAFFDSTGLAGTIATIPEPACAVSLIALTALLPLRRPRTGGLGFL